MESFRKKLERENLALNTITAYLYAVKDFLSKHQSINKQSLLLYKVEQVERFKPKTVNLRIQALNKYLEHIGKARLRLKSLKIQQKSYLENVISQADYDFLKTKLKQGGELMWYFLIRFLGGLERE